MDENEKIKRSFTVKRKDYEFLKDVAKTSNRYKGKASTGLRMLIDLYRTIKEKG